VILPLAVHAMRTRFELVLIGDDPSHLRAVGEEALEEIVAVEARLSRFDKSSVVTRINRHAAQEAVRVDADTFALLAECERLWHETQGAFDPTIGPLMRSLGLQDACAAGSRELTVEEARAAVGWRTVELDGENHTVRFQHRDTSIDLGAIGKGYALDLAAAILSEHDVHRAILHGGTSTSIALGAPPQCAGWRIALGSPKLDKEARVLELCDEALSVSERTVEQRAHAAHVIDPQTGRAATGAERVAVRVHDAKPLAGCGHSFAASRADAWSTALLVRSDLTLPDSVARESWSETQSFRDDFASGSRPDRSIATRALPAKRDGRHPTQITQTS
jgi:thiamine biosynthesis lipoprotein